MTTGIETWWLGPAGLPLTQFPHSSCCCYRHCGPCPRCCVVAGHVSLFKFPSVVGAERVLRGIVDVASSGHMTVCAATKISSSPLWCTTANWHMTRSVHSHANIYTAQYFKFLPRLVYTAYILYLDYLDYLFFCLVVVMA